MSIFDRFLGSSDTRIHMPTSISKPLIEWASMLSKREICRHLQDHVEVIRPESEELLRRLANQVRADPATRGVGDMLARKHTILVRARENGATRGAARDACVNEFGALWTLDLPTWLEALVAELEDLTGSKSEALIEAIERARRDAAVPAEVVAALQIECADALVDEGGPRVKEAMQLLNQAQHVFTRERFPRYYGEIQMVRGIAYCRLADDHPDPSNLHGAVTNLETALPYYTREAAPEEWATIHTYLGAAYGQLGQIAQAEAHLRDALTVFSIHQYPEKYSVVQTLLNAAAKDRQGRTPVEEDVLDIFAAQFGREFVERLRAQRARHRNEE